MTGGSGAFKSQEAFDKWMEADWRASREKLYADVLRYVRGKATISALTHWEWTGQTK